MAKKADERENAAVTGGDSGGAGVRWTVVAGAAAVAAAVIGVLLLVRGYAEAGVASLATVLPLGYAFGAGMVASVNPCGFIMLPSYLSFYLGSEEGSVASASQITRLGRALVLAGVVTLGFVLAFASVGSVVALGGRALAAYFPVGGMVIGIALAALGIWLLVSRRSIGIMAASRVSVAPRKTVWNGFLFGLAYAVGSLSCTLPIFLVVVGSALATRGLGASFGQFVAYSLGMGSVLTVATVGAALFGGAVFRMARGLFPHLHTVSALFLIAAGGYIIYYWLRYGNLFS